MLFISVLPFVVFTILLLGFKLTIFRTSLYTLLLTAFEVVLFWQIDTSYFIASVNKGFFLALDIFFIIFGALVFLNILNSAKVIDSLITHLELVSKDIRIQTILLAWFFSNFLEGTAGFGTPATIVAPILISLGLSPINAVAICLMGNSASGIFGAAGTPIRVGFASLDSTGVAPVAALFNFVGIVVPVFMVWLICSHYKDKHQRFIEILPFALWSGFCFSFASYLATFLGPEFPTIIGAFVGLLITLLTNHLGIFVPKTVLALRKTPKSFRLLSLTKSTFPYLSLVVCLLLGKLLLNNYSILIPLFNHKLNLFNPGFIFLLVSVPVAYYLSAADTWAAQIKTSFLKSLEPFFIMALMSVMVQLMLNSGHNQLNMPSIIDNISLVFNNRLLPLAAPFIGAFGSFITGSVTISSLMFGNFLAVSASTIGFSVPGVLALQLVGAAAGNMIALADILTAETVTGLKHQELQVISRVILPCLTCLILAGVLGLITLSM